MRAILRLPPIAMTMVTLVFVGLGGLPRTLAQASLAGPNAVGDIQVSVKPAEIRPDESFTVIVDLTIKSGMHIQAAKPAQDYLVGTEIKPDHVEGVVWNDPRFPNPTERVDPTLGTMAEYTGKLRIEVPGKVQAAAEPGSRYATLNLRYQACTDQGTCYPPKTIGVRVPLNILPGAAPATSTGVQGAPVPQDVAPLSPSPSRAASAGQDAGAPHETPGTPAGTRLPWQPFSTPHLADLTAAGKTVLIDFTADWCPNCKFNEHFALDTRATADLVRHNGVVPLLADFTHEDPEIKAWLARFSSISVPLTVVVPSGRSGQAILLRDTYRPRTLLAALELAGPSRELAEPRQALTLKFPADIELMSVALGDGEGAPAKLVSERPAEGSIGWYLLAGFLGGFVLNFMPCVLPVISIKVLSLLGQAGESRGRVFGLGLAFSGGMLGLFLVLGVLVVAAGKTWGTSFQRPEFLLVMLGIVVAMACSLFGAFTLTVPAVVGDADAAIEGEGYAGSFGKGMLAVLLGTPCSGPLLGSALAWSAAKSAAGQPAVALLVFAAMGLGMAFPFLVLAAQPGWMRYLPKPGAWMETFKQFMGFLLLLTAVYIIWLLRDHVVAALLYTLGIGFAAWLYGKLVGPLRSARANWVGRGVVVVLVAALVWASFVSVPAGSLPKSPFPAPIQSCNHDRYQQSDLAAAVIAAARHVVSKYTL